MAIAVYLLPHTLSASPDVIATKAAPTGFVAIPAM